MVELVNGLNVRKHLRYHILREHVMGTVFLVDPKVKHLLNKEKNKRVRNDNGDLNKHMYVWGTTVAQRLRCCATNWKVGGSIPDGVGIFH
jgi:hypothetical protein